MIGVTINFVYDIFTYTEPVNGKDKLGFELYNKMFTKVFETEREAVQWIIDFIPVYNAIPLELLNQKKKISLDQCIATLHKFWNEENNRKLYHYHNSRIIRFGDGIISCDDDEDEGIYDDNEEEEEEEEK